METDAYLAKLRQDIVFTANLSGHPFTFHSTWGLFSPREIDEGTLLLLDYIELDEDSDCFDLGCGYGPIGITLAARAPKGRTLMVDKDFIAVEYANANAERNGVGNASAQLSNGFDRIDPQLRFDPGRPA